MICSTKLTSKEKNTDGDEKDRGDAYFHSQQGRLICSQCRVDVNPCSFVSLLR